MTKIVATQSESQIISDNYCSTGYAAKLLGVSIGTIQQLVKSGELSAWLTHGGHRRILMSSIRTYKLKNNINEKSFSNNHRHVLLVEDDIITSEMLQYILSKVLPPVDCTVASSGLEALMNITKIKPHILILDLEIPGIDGFELLRTLRHNSQFQNLMILVISTLSLEEIESKGGLPSDVIYKSKPIKADWLYGLFSGLNVHLNANEKFSKPNKLQPIRYY